MVSSIAGTVAELGGTFGIVPAGRGNDFARMLGLPKAPQDLAKILLAGSARQIDLLRLDLSGQPSRIVAGSVYAGVDAVAREVVDKVRWMPSSLQYPYAAARALATYKPVDLLLCVDGESRHFQAATVVIANSKFYGSGMKIAPSAEIDDGVLDIVVVEASKRRALLRSLPKVYDGSHVEVDEVHVLRGQSVLMHGSPSLPIGGDGEPLGHLPTSPEGAARVEVLPGALKLLLPG